MKYNKKIKFGILGLGRVIEKRVAKVFKKELINSEISTIFDKDKRKKNKFKKIFNCKSSNSIDDFFKKDLDFVYIATESGNHYEHILKSFKFNKNVIVEKPPVLKLNQLLELNKISKKKNLLFYVVYQNRFNKSVQFLKKNISKITDKKIIFANLNLLWSRNQNYYKDWHGKWKMDGGVLAQQGVHYIDLLCYLFGKPKKCISTISKKTNRLEAEDTHSSLIVFENNISCSINLTTALKPKDIEASIKIYSRNNTIKLYGLCCNKIKIYDHFSKNKKFNKFSKDYSEEVPSGYGLSHRIVFQRLIDSYLNITKNKPTFAIETLDTLKLIHMMYKSYEKKKWVSFNESNIISRLGN